MLVAVLHRSDSRLYGTVNARVTDRRDQFASKLEIRSAAAIATAIATAQACACVNFVMTITFSIGRQARLVKPAMCGASRYGDST